jgi:PTH1 family peptidyl-tRNA hydrolase
LKFVVGIGNPGGEYRDTRHNVGFRVVDALKKTRLTSGLKLLKPATYVNRTGPAVREALKKHGLAPLDVLIVCDDVHLPLGKLRLRSRGSSGGHKGLTSVIEALETEEFARLRVGVGKEPLPKDLARYVLEVFSKADEKALPEILEKAVKVCRAWAEEGLDAAMNVLSQLQSVNGKGVKE